MGVCAGFLPQRGGIPFLGAGAGGPRCGAPPNRWNSISAWEVQRLAVCESRLPFLSGAGNEPFLPIGSPSLQVDFTEVTA